MSERAHMWVFYNLMSVKKFKVLPKILINVLSSEWKQDLKAIIWCAQDRLTVIGLKCFYMIILQAVLLETLIYQDLHPQIWECPLPVGWSGWRHPGLKTQEVFGSRSLHETGTKTVSSVLLISPCIIQISKPRVESFFW